MRPVVPVLIVPVGAVRVDDLEGLRPAIHGDQRQQLVLHFSEDPFLFRFAVLHPLTPMRRRL